MKTRISFVTGLIVFVEFSLKTPVSQAADYWMNANTMLHARYEHTATLLQNGKVLIAGWDSQEAELYDYESGLFTAAGSTLYNHRQGATATLLNDGRVLIAGGVNAQQMAELYDPQTGHFQLTDSLNTVHCYHSATLLSDGRVLIAGGQDQSGPQTHAICEIFDPQSGLFTLTGSLNAHRSGHTATLLPDGRVLVAAGVQTTTPGFGFYLDACELYDPAEGSFSLIQHLDQSRSGNDATLLGNGKVFISCGSWYQAYGELYDVMTDTWSLTGSMTVMRRNAHTATLLENGKVLLAGGFINAATSSAECYDPLTSTFIAADSMHTARMGHTATRLPDGNVLVTGGHNTSGVINLAELYIVDTTVTVGINNEMDLHNAPATFQLVQNYPNPFNPVTTVQFQIPVSARVGLSVFTMNGRKIRTLINGQYNAGTHAITWNGLDDAGRQVPNGIYLTIMESDGYHDVIKMIFLK